MRVYLSILSLALLSACGSTFDNVLVLSLTGDRAFVSSLYGPVGITAELRDEDAAELRRLIRKVENER